MPTGEAESENADICPVCGSEYEEIIGPPKTEFHGDTSTALEETLMDGICGISVGEKVFMVIHEYPHER